MNDSIKFGISEGAENMHKELTLQDMQQIELKLLIYLKNICEENQLKYYLAYGTLIGAVRHQGFIPWDDDIDVMMPQEDYNKLVNIMREHPHPYYRLVSIDTYPNFTAPLPKMIDTRTVLEQHYDFVERVQLGVYIDIFILNGLTDDFETAIVLRKESWKRYLRWRRADSTLFPPGKSRIYGLARRVKNLPYKLFGISRSVKKLAQNNSKFSFYQNRFVDVLNAALREDQTPATTIMQNEWFGEGIDLPFEGIMFKAPAKYDTILRNYYGNYMKLPPENERKSVHDYTVYWRT